MARKFGWRKQKLCRICAEADSANFYKTSASLCKKCTYPTYAQSQKDSTKKYRQKNQEKVLAWRLAGTPKLRVDNTARRIEIRLETLSYYGPNHTLQCSWPDCTIVDSDMLVLDHINDNGAAQRKEGCGRGWNFYRWLKKHEFPAGYQTLCCNHNHKKELLRSRRARSSSQKVD